MQNWIDLAKTAAKKLGADLPVDMAWDGIKHTFGAALNSLTPKDIRAIKVHLGAPPDLDDEKISDKAKGLLRAQHANALRKFELRLNGLDAKSSNRLRLIVVEDPIENPKDEAVERRRREQITADNILDYLYLDDVEFDTFTFVAFA